MTTELENPLSPTERDAMVKALKSVPAIRNQIEKAKTVGMDMEERERHLNEAETALKALLDAYFPGSY